MFVHEGMYLRKVDERDLNWLLELKSESWFGTHRVSIVNSENQKKYIDSLNNQDIHNPKDLILVGETENDQGYDTPVGIFKILNTDWTSRRAEVGWDIYRLHRRRGYGKRIVRAGVEFCFQLLNLRRLDAQILQTNEASVKCAEAAGFVKEGVQAQAIYKNGVYLDNFIYGKLRG